MLNRKKLNRILFGSIAVIGLVLGIYETAEAGKSASTTALSKATVVKSISISKNADLDFGAGYTGDAALTLDPNAQEGANFTVGGEANMAYNITLPSSTTMTTGDGVGADKQILVDTFSSNPATSGNIGSGGSQTLYVGAKRAALSNTQVSGAYSSIITVTVAYP